MHDHSDPQPSSSWFGNRPAWGGGTAGFAAVGGAATGEDPGDALHDALHDAAYGGHPALPSPGRLRRLVATAPIPKALLVSWLRFTDSLADYLHRRERLGRDRGERFLPHPEIDDGDLEAMIRAIDELELQADGVSHLIRAAAAGRPMLPLSALGIALGDVVRVLDDEGQRMRTALARM
ncbi:MAG: hypothetical protein D6798_06990 [Deltaproteobacteria bacterium]|nr:MAG: hypothetical protein D6798_06990 [Deltaproteobacteria bacterium]